MSRPSRAPHSGARSWFHESALTNRPLRIFPHGWNVDAAALAPRVAVADFLEQLNALARGSIASLTHSVIYSCGSRSSEGMTDADSRELCGRLSACRCSGESHRQSVSCSPPNAKHTMVCTSHHRLCRYMASPWTIHLALVAARPPVSALPMGLLWSAGLQPMHDGCREAPRGSSKTTASTSPYDPSFWLCQSANAGRCEKKSRHQSTFSCPP